MGLEDLTLVVNDLLREISQYQIGNTNEIFTQFQSPNPKSLKARFNALNSKEITNFLCSCDSKISEIQKNPCLTPELKKENSMMVLNLYKIAKPIASKKMRCQF